MPNHVTTRCVITGDLDAILQFRKLYIVTVENKCGDYLKFDFDRIIPMPECLKDADESCDSHEAVKVICLLSEDNVNAGNGLYVHQIERIRASVNMPHESLSKVARAYLLANPEYWEKGKKRIENILETGYGGWYQWSIDNWGTKWNSYDFEQISVAPFTFTFDTAWSFPEPIFKELAEMFPMLHFYCQCFDEAWNFAGEGYYNPPAGCKRFDYCDATKELYEAVYGEPPDNDVVDAMGEVTVEATVE